MELDRHAPTIRLRAVVLDDEGRPRLADVDDPDDAVDVVACGLCGSDVEKIGRAPAGTVLGHEVVVRTGSRRLALVHHRPCGDCARCRSGHESTCEEFAAATIVPGGLAERVRSTDGVEVPASLDDARAIADDVLADDAPAWEVVAIRYGTRMTTRGTVYVDDGRLDDPDAALQMDYFFWLLRGEAGTIVWPDSPPGRLNATSPS